MAWACPAPPLRASLADLLASRPATRQELSGRVASHTYTHLQSPCLLALGQALAQCLLAVCGQVALAYRTG